MPSDTIPGLTLSKPQLETIARKLTVCDRLAQDYKLQLVQLYTYETQILTYKRMLLEEHKIQQDFQARLQSAQQAQATTQNQLARSQARHKQTKWKVGAAVLVGVLAGIVLPH